MTDTPATNGAARPCTPQMRGLSLTEYTANPSPPSERHDSAPDWNIPEDFLLPNGHPDVFLPYAYTGRIFSLSNHIVIVSTIDPNLPSVRCHLGDPHDARRKPEQSLGITSFT